MSQLIFKNVNIYDGIQLNPYQGVVCCQNGIISDITSSDKNISFESKCEIINGENLILAPGFIDVHSHSDASLVEKFSPVGKLSQGITTEINGNCGLSPFPLTEFNFSNISQVYKKYPEFTNILQKNAPNFNFLEYKKLQFSLPHYSLVGYNTLRAAVSGYQQKSPLNAEQINEMIKLLRSELIAGAIGISGGFLYTPGCFASQSEIIKVLRGVNDLEVVFCCHLRSEGDEICEAIAEMIKICQKAKINRLHISHLKVAKKSNWHKITDVFELINNCASPKISFDRYPYIESLSSLSLTLPNKFTSMPDADIHKYLQNEQNYNEVLEQLNNYDNDRFDKIIIASTPSTQYAKYCGQSISEAVKCDKNNLTPPELLLKILREDCVATLGAFRGGMNIDNMNKIITDNRCLCGTDEVSRPLDYSLGRSHPRGFGSFPKFARILTKNGYSIGEIINRFTSQSVDIFNLQHNKIGAIKKGYQANLILLDFDEFISSKNEINFSNPHKITRGIKGCWIKGKKVY